MDQENIISGDTAVTLGLIHKVNPGLQIHVSVVTENEITESAQSELSRDIPELVKLQEHYTLVLMNLCLQLFIQ